MGASRSARCSGGEWRDVIESEGWGYGGGDGGSISDRREGTVKDSEQGVEEGARAFLVPGSTILSPNPSSPFDN